MFFRLIPVLILTALVLIGITWLRRQPPGKKRQAMLRLAFGILIITLVILAITGRIHWVGALLGALIPVAKVLLGMALQLLPMWRNRNGGQQTSGAGAKSELTEALDTLGLSQQWQLGTVTPDQVHDAHKRLMQKVHPDRGGNDFLAAKVNKARETVLKHINR
ncbi:MAG TPA: molecular chaperone DnaJ [Cellvibrionaceae bacterium]